MPQDAAYLAKINPIARLLVESSCGDFNAIPSWYSDFLYHEYDDGDVSLMGTLSKFRSESGLESWELDDIFDLISKVDPDRWPDPDDIESVDTDRLVSYHFSEECPEFVEDNLGASEKVQRVLKAVIESVFEDSVGTIRDKKGKFPSPSNNFLQSKDGTFEGTFKHGDFEFLFEVTPTESGWICSYRLSEKSLDKLEFPEPKKEVSVRRKSFRARGW